MTSISNNVPSTSAARTDSMRSTASSTSTGHHALEGVNVTAASTSAISLTSSRLISSTRISSRINPETLQGLMGEDSYSSGRSQNSDSARVRSTVMHAFDELAGMQRDGRTALQIETHKLHMLGVACQLEPNIASMGQACDFLNQNQSNVSEHIKPPFTDHNFSGSPIEQTVNRFTATDSLFREALASDVPPPIKESIELAHNRFKDEVRQTLDDAKGAITHNEATAARTELQLERTKALVEASPEQAELLVEAQRMHDLAKANLAEAKSNLGHLTKNATSHILLEEIIAKNEEATSGAGTKAKVIWGATLPGGVLSAIHFGTLKGWGDTGLQHASMATRIIGGGAVLGGAHKFVNDTLKPISVYVVEKLGGQGVKPVPADSVYPSAPRVVSRDGEVHVRSDEELKPLNDEIDKKKADFTAGQANNKLGTLKGDFQAHAAFALGHAGIRGIPAAIHVPASVSALAPAAAKATDAAITMTVPWFRTLGSFAGGAGTGAWQAYAQLSQKIDGRHTHVPADANPNLEKTWNDTKAGFKNATNILDSKVRIDYLSRISGSTIYNATTMPVHAAIAANTDQSEALGRTINHVVATGGDYLPGLTAFFANTQAGVEAQAGIKAGIYKDEGVARITNAIENIQNPDRPTLTHGTEAGTWARTAENAFHVARGVTQLPAQMAAVAGEAIVGPLVDQGVKLAKGIADTAGALLSTPPAVNAEVELTEIVIDGGGRTGQTGQTAQNPPPVNTEVELTEIVVDPRGKNKQPE